jgi:hypothetical protein
MHDVMLGHLAQASAPQQQPSFWGQFDQPGTPPSPGPQTWSDWLHKTYRPSVGDLAKIYADAYTGYQLPTALSALQHVGGVGPGPDAMRASIQASRNAAGPLGPAMDVAAMMTPGPMSYGLGALGGLGSKAVGAAEPFLEQVPQAVQRVMGGMIGGGAQSGAVAGAKSYGGGSSPTQALLDAAKAIPTGAILGGGVSAIPVKGASFEDIPGKTAAAKADALQNVTDVANSAPAQTMSKTAAEAQAAANKAYIEDYVAKGGSRDQAQRNAASATNQDYIGRNFGTGAAQQELDAANAAQAARTAQAQAQLKDAVSKENWGNTLRDWYNTQHLPGRAADIQRQAAQTAQTFPYGSPQFEAMSRVANPSPGLRAKLPQLGGWLGQQAGTLGGEFAGQAFGLPPGIATATGIGGNVLGNAGARMLFPGAPGTALQRAIVAASKPMTGHSVSSDVRPNIIKALATLNGALFSRP